MAGGFLRTDGDDLILAVRLTPRSARDAIGGVWRDEKDMCWLRVSVRAVPESGRANGALIQLIAKRLSVAAKEVRLESGDTARLKRLRLTGLAREAETIETELDGS